MSWVNSRWIGVWARLRLCPKDEGIKLFVGNFSVSRFANSNPDEGVSAMNASFVLCMIGPFLFGFDLYYDFINLLDTVRVIMRYKLLLLGRRP